MIASGALEGRCFAEAFAAAPLIGFSTRHSFGALSMVNAPSWISPAIVRLDRLCRDSRSSRGKAGHRSSLGRRMLSEWRVRRRVVLARVEECRRRDRDLCLEERNIRHRWRSLSLRTILEESNLHLIEIEETPDDVVHSEGFSVVIELLRVGLSFPFLRSRTLGYPCPSQAGPRSRTTPAEQCHWDLFGRLRNSIDLQRRMRPSRESSARLRGYLCLWHLWSISPHSRSVDLDSDRPIRRRRSLKRRRAVRAERHEPHEPKPLKRSWKLSWTSVGVPFALACLPSRGPLLPSWMSRRVSWTICRIGKQKAPVFPLPVSAA